MTAEFRHIHKTGVSARPDAGAWGPRTAAVLPTAVVVLISLLLFSRLSAGTALVASERPDLTWLWCLVVGLPTLAFAGVGYAGMERFARRFCRAATMFLLVYFATEPFFMPRPGLEEGSFVLWFHQNGRWIGLGLAALGWLRPAFVFAGAMVLWMLRDLNPVATGMYFSNLDIRNTVEAISFVVIGQVLVSAVAGLTPVATALGLHEANMRARARIGVIAASIGGHFSSYFLSAIAKLSLNGGPLSWLLDNRFEHIVLGALERGSFPWAAWPAVTDAVYTGLAWVSVPLNVTAFAVQAAALIAPIRLRWLIGLTALYDLFHLTVYLVAGLLFWKWMALNTVFLVTLVALRQDRPDLWDRSAKTICLAFVLVGGLWFRIAFLAWYETPAFVSPYIEAETESGTTHRVPPAYFGISSYQVSQGWLHVPDNTRHFPFCVWGSCHDYGSVLRRRACDLPEKPTSQAQRPVPLDQVRAWMADHHENVVEAAGADGIWNYFLYLHHHMPSPFTNMDFYRLDKRKIAEYRLVLESVCLSLENGRLQRDVRLRDSFSLYEVSE